MSPLWPVLALLSVASTSLATPEADDSGGRLVVDCYPTNSSRDVAQDVARGSRASTELTFNDCVLDGFDFGFLSAFPDLRYLNVYGGSLEEFRGMPFLPTLSSVTIAVANFRTFWAPGLTPSLSYLRLERLPDDAAIDGILQSALSYKENITFLIISDTGATRVPPTVKEFANTNYFWFRYNDRTRNLTRGTFPSTFRPIYLYLYDNNIEHIEAGTFEGDFGGRYLHLTGNDLASFDEDVFGSVLRSMEAAADGFLSLGRVGPCDCSVRWIFDDNAILINYLWTGQCERPDLGWVDVQYLPPSYFVDCFDEALS